MDSLIEYFITHPVEISFSPTIIVTWFLLWCVWRANVSITDAVLDIKLALTRATTELKVLSEMQKIMHKENIIKFTRAPLSRRRDDNAGE